LADREDYELTSRHGFVSGSNLQLIEVGAIIVAFGAGRFLGALSAEVVIEAVCQNGAYPSLNRHVSTPRHHPGRHPLVCGSFLFEMSSKRLEMNEQPSR
jgi:hypothetical protein